MADSTILPGQRATLVDRSGVTSPEFYRFFRSLSVTAELPARVDDLTVRVAALEESDSTTGNVVGKQSIVSSGILSNGQVLLRLDGDVDIAPALSFYGALTAGAKGWQTYSANFAALNNGDGTSSLDLADLADSGAGALLATTFDAKGRKTGSRAATITGTAGRITVANGNAAAGVPTIDLATVADGGGGALLRFVRDAWGRITGTSAATTDDLTEGSNLYYTDARADARITTAKADPNGVASLVGGKLDAGQLPALAITETFVVNTQAAMLALTAQEGDVAVRTDLSKSFILTAAPATTLANWQELLTPTSPVTSVFGRVGSVTAASGDYVFAQIGSTPTTLAGYGITDAEPAFAAGTAAQYRRGDKTWQTLNKGAVGLGNVDNTSDVNKPVSTAQAAANALKFDKTGGTLTGSLNMSGVGANGQVFFSGTPGGGNEGYVYTDSSNGLRFFFIIEATDKVVLCNRAANGVLHLRANNATVGGAGESTVAIVNALGLLAGSDNSKTLGGSSSRWSVVYAATGSINTSDAREKTDVATLTADELAAAADLARAPGTYQWLSAVQAKGADARLHVGLTVQRAIEIMQSHGLDPMRYGFICYDEWDELPEIVTSWPEQDAVLDDEGNVITPAVEAGSEITQAYRPAGDRYSFRHDELLLFIARGFAARLDALESA